jgi:tripartite ATP-independent transporter DctP family solute receptor
VKEMSTIMKKTIISFWTLLMVFNLTGCSLGDGQRIVRISHSQAETHPDHLGLVAFEEYVESRLGDKYDVQIFPNEILGSSVKAIELVQTGAIDFAVASTGNLETFDNIYQIFSMPYLFDSVEQYYTVMENEELMSSIFESTDESGFRAVTWFTAGTRNFYAKKPINNPDDLKGLKIRVQANPTNIRMMELLGAAAAPMSFGEVYTAIQSGVIDGAENNELALTSNKHGEVAKFYTYNQHQMVPDLLIGNLRFLESLSEEERQIFEEAAKISNEVERDAWDGQIEAAKEEATAMGVEFLETDIEPFKEKVLPLHEELLAKNEKLQPIYNRIGEIAKELKEGK